MGLPSIQLIAKERVNQISDGKDAAHDDGHNDGELRYAACELLLNCGGIKDQIQPSVIGTKISEKFADDPIRALTVAGALISAELDRCLRLQAKGSTVVHEVHKPKGTKKSKRKAKAKSRKNSK